MSDDLKSYRILGREGEPQRVDGQTRAAGDVVEMTAEAAEFYLREGRIEEAKPARTRAARDAAAAEA